jgi:hypothetical protein
MLRMCRALLVAWAAAAASTAAFAAPPRVIEAVPDNGDRDVDPSLKEIRVTFDQDMSRSGHSICGGR